MRNEDEEKLRIRTRADDVASRLDLGWLTVVHKFRSVGADGDQAETSADWQYRQGAILWNLGQTVLLEESELEAVAVHEFVHVLIAPLWNELPEKLQEKLAKHNELATENVARAILAAMQR